MVRGRGGEKGGKGEGEWRVGKGGEGRKGEREGGESRRGGLHSIKASPCPSCVTIILRSIACWLHNSSD